jgi:hypothetical protein
MQFPIIAKRNRQSFFGEPCHIGNDIIIVTENQARRDDGSAELGLIAPLSEQGV